MLGQCRIICAPTQEVVPNLINTKITLVTAREIPLPRQCSFQPLFSIYHRPNYVYSALHFNLGHVLLLLADKHQRVLLVHYSDVIMVR